MSRRVAVVLALVFLVTLAATGAGVYRALRDHTPSPPEISVYSAGETLRLAPIKQCRPDLSGCTAPGVTGILPVDRLRPVQLSVDTPISAAPWRLLRFYEDEGDPALDAYTPDATPAVTIPTVDALRGRLVGIGVFLPTLVRTGADDELIEVPHIEWSVRMDWEWRGSAPSGG